MAHKNTLGEYLEWHEIVWDCAMLLLKYVGTVTTVLWVLFLLNNIDNKVVF
jgi:hypothetical protein